MITDRLISEAAVVALIDTKLEALREISKQLLLRGKDDVPAAVELLVADHQRRLLEVVKSQLRFIEGQ